MLSPSIAPLLAVEGLQAWYGESHVLHGATFEVLPGEVVRCWAAMAPARRRR